MFYLFQPAATEVLFCSQAGTGEFAGKFPLTALWRPLLRDQPEEAIGGFLKRAEKEK